MVWLLEYLATVQAIYTATEEPLGKVAEEPVPLESQQ